MSTIKHFQNVMVALAAITSPIWASILCFILAVYVGDFFTPLTGSRLGQIVGGLIFWFMVISSTIFFITGNIVLSKRIKVGAFKKVVLCGIYSTPVAIVQSALSVGVILALS